jgi:hypothetical protein
MTSVIHGSDLIIIGDQTDLPPSFIQEVDPEGFNVVYRQILHGRDIRVNALCKLKGNPEGVEALFTIPITLFNKIVQHVDLTALRAIN